MQRKEKQQQARLSANVLQAKANLADARKPAANAAKKPPAKQTGGPRFLDRIFGGKPPKSAQESIPYREMYRDGICRLTDSLYSKTVSFGDITYFLADKETQTQIFENYSDFINYFDSSVEFQLSSICQRANKDDLRLALTIPDHGRRFREISDEYQTMLNEQ